MSTTAIALTSMGHGAFVTLCHHQRFDLRSHFEDECHECQILHSSTSIKGSTCHRRGENLNDTNPHIFGHQSGHPFRSPT